MRDRATFASDPAQSRGRVHGTDASPTRSVFQRDRDRIIHSTAFRRLQHKTQVFLHHEGRHFRTRLTHTLEVSQIARSLARALGGDEDLAEAVALAHDLGHPPFGHAGERVLDERMRDYGGFDHNMQAIRVVTRIENRYAEHDGLNLSWEALEGILKHNGPLLDADGEAFGRYRKEGLPFGWQDFAGEGEGPDLALITWPSLEAQLAAIADDIAYNSHDVDDAIRAGLLDLETLSGVPFAGDIQHEVATRWPDLDLSRQAHEIQRRLITRMVEDVIATTTVNLADLTPSTADDIRIAGRPVASFSRQMGEDVLALKAFLFTQVYRSEEVMVPVRAGQAMVGAIFDHFRDGGELPARWQRMAEATEMEGRARIVCDFVAGMTDPYAIELHAQLFDAKPEFG